MTVGHTLLSSQFLFQKEIDELPSPTLPTPLKAVPSTILCALLLHIFSYLPYISKCTLCSGTSDNLRPSGCTAGTPIDKTASRQYSFG